MESTGKSFFAIRSHSQNSGKQSSLKLFRAAKPVIVHKNRQPYTGYQHTRGPAHNQVPQLRYEMIHSFVNRSKEHASASPLHFSSIYADPPRWIPLRPPQQQPLPKPEPPIRLTQHHAKHSQSKDYDYDNLTEIPIQSAQNTSVERVQISIHASDDILESSSLESAKSYKSDPPCDK